MSTDDLQPNQQESASKNHLRQKLLQEIANPLPAPCANSAPPEASEAEEVEYGNIHPFRDLNLSSFARRVDTLFLQRWLEGEDSNK